MQKLRTQMNILLKKEQIKINLVNSVVWVKKYIMKTQFTNKNEFLDTLIGN